MNFRVSMLTVLALAGGLWAAAPVRIHLPREAQVSGTAAVRLSDVGVIVCDDPEVRKLVESLPLGRAPWARETIVLTRPMILAGLASRGVTGSQVTLTGAQQVALRRYERLFAPDEVARAAQTFLKNLPDSGEGKWRLAGKCAELAVPGGVDVQLQARLTAPAGQDSVTVRVVATDGKDVLAGVDVPFRRTYTLRQAVAVTDIAPGQPLTVQNVRVEEVDVDRQPVDAWLPAPTAVAGRAIARGTVIRPDLVDQPKTVAVVRRNQSVVMRLAGEGFTVTTLAEALQDGRVGQVIKVRNVDTKRIVSGTVMSDGTVQPRYDEVNP